MNAITRLRADYLDAAEVIARLEEAGRMLLAQRLRHPGPASAGSCMPTPVRDFWETYGSAIEPLRAALPGARDITRMDEALAWIPRYIPADRYVLRRIVQMRLLTRFNNGRPVYSWRVIGTVLGCHPKAAERWHAQGIGLIVSGLNRLSV